MNNQEALLPTTVIGSYATPSWLWTATTEIDKGEYGQSDIRETFDDAVNMAILDQERAGVDIITDGEMRRWYFVQSFYRRMSGLATEPPLRKTGLYGYDSPTRYRTTGKVLIPEGLGIVDEYNYTKSHTDHSIKVTCPGPLTLTMHIRPRDGYNNRLELAWEFAELINAELKSLVAAGADYIQIDEPSFAIIPGELSEWISLFNSTVAGVDAKIALHICFGNLASRPRGKRSYRWMFPALLETDSDQLVFEYANREMTETDIWKEFSVEKELGAGIVDVKSFYVEQPEEIAERIRVFLEYVDPARLYISPDCGFFQLPRWISYIKLESMVAGAAIVRNEISGTGL